LTKDLFSDYSTTQSLAFWSSSDDEQQMMTPMMMMIVPMMIVSTRRFFQEGTTSRSVEAHLQLQASGGWYLYVVSYYRIVVSTLTLAILETELFLGLYFN